MLREVTLHPNSPVKCAVIDDARVVIEIEQGKTTTTTKRSSTSYKDRKLVSTKVSDHIQQTGNHFILILSRDTPTLSLSCASTKNCRYYLYIHNKLINFGLQEYWCTNLPIIFGCFLKSDIPMCGYNNIILILIEAKFRSETTNFPF